MMNLYFNCFVEEYKIKNIYNKTLLNFDEVNIDDNKKNLLILKATLLSYSKLNINMAFFNIDFDKNFSDSDKENVKNYIEENFKIKKLKINLSRPNSLKEWKINSQEIKTFFDDYPLIYTFNHDHIFSGPSIEILEKLVENFSKLSKDRENHVMCISHHPEYCSLSLDIDSFNNRIFRQNMNINFSLNERFENFNTFKVENYIEGNFIAHKNFGSYLWSKAFQSYGSKYIPRPDHNTVRYEGLNIIIYVASEELFRHFEGYNHVTNLYNYDFSFVVLKKNQKNEILSYRINNTYKYRPLILDKNNLTKGNLNDIQDDAQYLIRLYFIAFRDYVFNQLFISKKTIDTKKFVRQILNHYFGSNLTLLKIAENNKIQLYREILLNLNENLHKFVNDCLLLVGNSDDFMSIGPISLREKLTNLNDIKDEDQKKNFFFLDRIIKKINKLFK